MRRHVTIALLTPASTTPSATPPMALLIVTGLEGLRHALNVNLAGLSLGAFGDQSFIGQWRGLRILATYSAPPTATPAPTMFSLFWRLTRSRRPSFAFDIVLLVFRPGKFLLRLDLRRCRHNVLRNRRRCLDSDLSPHSLYSKLRGQLPSLA